VGDILSGVKIALYALFGSKQDMLIDCIRARTKRFQARRIIPAFKADDSLTLGVCAGLRA
jgi:hypothetical protein